MTDNILATIYIPITRSVRAAADRLSVHWVQPVTVTVLRSHSKLTQWFQSAVQSVQSGLAGSDFWGCLSDRPTVLVIRQLFLPGRPSTLISLCRRSTMISWLHCLVHWLSLLSWTENETDTEWDYFVRRAQRTELSQWAWLYNCVYMLHMMTWVSLIFNDHIIHVCITAYDWMMPWSLKIS